MVLLLQNNLTYLERCTYAAVRDNKADVQPTTGIDLKTMVRIWQNGQYRRSSQMQ